MTTQFVATPTNMVRLIESTIEGYRMGPLRALAQDPVQNSMDAKRQGRVRVEYRLLRRKSQNRTPYFLLTVTDSGTTGLQGPVLSPGELEARGYALQRGENWAAFEGQGFTKKGDGDLGSRGQGKAAFLYHSNPPRTAAQGEQRLILYDTLLEGGEYRLGVRYARPADTIMTPPRLGREARAAIEGDFQVPDGPVVPLGLEPLKAVGTRVMIPYLSQEAADAIRTRELHRWLQRCWWRAIQIGDLEISVVDDAGQTEMISVPHWWKDEPWKGHAGDSAPYAQESVPVESSLKIKRIVLHYDEDWESDEIDGCDAQYGGVQLLRGQQWVETIGAKSDLSDIIPAGRRNGFRGFIEFDRRLERVLAATEKPQHDHFDARNPTVRVVLQRIEDAVRQFAEEQGWLTEKPTRAIQGREQEVAAEFLRVFSSSQGPTRRTGSSVGLELGAEEALTWECRLALDFPRLKSSRVDWGESLRDVAATVKCEPAQGYRTATLSLEISRSGEPSVGVCAETNVEVHEGEGFAKFGDFQIIQGRGGPERIQCPDPGEWRLRARVLHAGQEVASAMRRIYVNADPPLRPDPKPQTLSIAVRNLSRRDERRIHSGDEISVQVTITNRAADDVALELDASLDKLLLADGASVSVEGVPLGDVPNKGVGVSERFSVYTSERLTDEKHVVLEPGRYYVRADLREASGDRVIAHASHPVYVEVDPAGNQPRLPFDIEAIEDQGPHPMWRLERQSGDDWVLKYPLSYPIYQALPEMQRQTSKLAGRSSFIAEVCANGLIKWALDPLLSMDSTRLEQLKASRPAQTDSVRWADYCEGLERLEATYGDSERFEELTECWRKSVADMLHIFKDLA